MGRPVTVALLVALFALLGSAGQAGAAEGTGVVDAAVEALREDVVYVHPDAEAALTPAEAEQLTDRILAADAGPIYVAVLPEAAQVEGGGDAGGLLGLVHDRLGRPGTYVVVSGTQLVAGSDAAGFEPGQVPALADAVIRERSGQGAAAVLFGFVDRLSAAASGEGDARGSWFGSAVLVVIVVAVIGLVTVGSRQRRRREQAELEEVREVAYDDLVALGEDLRALDLDVEMPGVDPAAKRDYVAALDSYERASRDLDRARRAADLEAVTAQLEEGRYAMASAKARLEGREPPAHRPPCFFDPRHGPSSREVSWAPPGGAVRDVPACEDDARRVEAGIEPAARQILVHGRSTPYWDAPRHFGPWIGGYYGGFGGVMLPGLFPGLFLGSTLGGLGWGHGWAGHGGDGGGFGGGDFGGFGGGDFGGGDFGGGDFG